MLSGIYIMDLEEDDAGSNSDSDGSPEVSIHAMTGIHAGDTMLLNTTVSEVPLDALIDSGSTHCFMSATPAARLGLQPTPRPGLTVGVANGNRVLSAGVCSNTAISIAGEVFYVDIYIIPLAGYELVLGCQWLRTLGPVLWDFKLKTMVLARCSSSPLAGRGRDAVAHAVRADHGGSLGTPSSTIQRPVR